MSTFLDARGVPLANGVGKITAAVPINPQPPTIPCGVAVPKALRCPVCKKLIGTADGCRCTVKIINEP